MSKDTNQLRKLKRGQVVHDEHGNAWVYVGFRITAVPSHEHHFACCDMIGHLGPWTYKAVNRKTLINKFPDILD